MAIRIDEIMNPEVYAVRPSEESGTVCRDLTRLQISGAPVVDEENRVLGVVSLKDLADQTEHVPVERVMSTPPLVVSKDMPIPLAARLMTEASCHRLVVVEDDKVVGVVGTLDIIRAQLGLPARRPETFPHYDAATGAVWSDDYPLDWGHLEAAPEAPGVLLVLRGGQDRPEVVVWGESAEDLRKKISSYLDTPGDSPTFVGYWRGVGDLRFRTATILDPDERRRVLAAALP